MVGAVVTVPSKVFLILFSHRLRLLGTSTLWLILFAICLFPLRQII